MYKLAIFDLDGTLLNTIDDLADAGNYALRLEGFPEHPAEAYKLFVGDGLRNMVLRSLPKDLRSDSGVVERVTTGFHQYYNAHSQEKTRPYDGITDALSVIRKAGVRIAVLSNKPEAYVSDLVCIYFPGMISYAHGQREGVPIKPDPTAVLQILEEANCTPEDCIYIGDTAVDMLTGKNAGLRTIGVLWGFRTIEELKSADASVIINNPDQLAKIVLDK